MVRHWTLEAQASQLLWCPPLATRTLRVRERERDSLTMLFSNKDLHGQFIAMLFWFIIMTLQARRVREEKLGHWRIPWWSFAWVLKIKIKKQDSNALFKKKIFILKMQLTDRKFKLQPHLQSVWLVQLMGAWKRWGDKRKTTPLKTVMRTCQDGFTHSSMYWSTMEKQYWSAFSGSMKQDPVGTYQHSATRFGMKYRTKHSFYYGFTVVTTKDFNPQNTVLKYFHGSLKFSYEEVD